MTKTAISTKGDSVVCHSQQKQIEVGEPAAADQVSGNILDYPYSYDQDSLETVVFQETLYKNQREQQMKLEQAMKEKLLFPHPSQTIKGFPKAKEFAQCLADMCTVEEKLESCRKELAIRTDFNLTDTFRMFTQGDNEKTGVDCDDLHNTTTSTLSSTMTKDEVFIVFNRCDKDDDGYWSFDELQQAFTPREKEYAHVLLSRSGFQAAETNFSRYFTESTRS
jgi:hypothetical protein